MRYKWLNKRIDDLVRRYESGQSLQEIADHFHLAAPTIHRRLKERDVDNWEAPYARTLSWTFHAGHEFDINIS